MLDKASALNMEAVAITDHGNIFGAVELFTNAPTRGIKPVLGCEIYVASGNRKDRAVPRDGSPNAYHLILLAMNEEGYRNLCRLVTLGHLEGFYYHPRVDMDLLREYNGADRLVSLSERKHPLPPQRRPMRRGEEEAKAFASIFDKDRFYLEVQANLLPEQRSIRSEGSCP